MLQWTPSEGEMRLFLPSQIDRYRLIEKILKQARACFPPDPGIHQAKLGELCELKQHEVSNIENITKTLDAKNRRITRTDLIKLMTWGLQLDKEKVDGLLWLFDGQILTPDEIRRYMPQYSYKYYTYDDLRSNVFNQLVDVLNRSFSPDGSVSATVRLFSADDQGRAATIQAYRDLEVLPGQRLMTTVGPSTLTMPPEWLFDARCIDIINHLQPMLSHDMPLTAKDRVTSVVKERHETFMSHLEQYGERGIHSKAFIKYYLDTNRQDVLSIHDRKRHIEHWIELMKNFPYYEVGFVDIIPDLELNIKSIVQAVMRGTINYGMRKEFRWGPAEILWLDEDSVLKFFLDFEGSWSAIPQEWRSKETVIPWLEQHL